MLDACRGSAAGSAPRAAIADRQLLSAAGPGRRRRRRAVCTVLAGAAAGSRGGAAARGHRGALPAPSGCLARAAGCGLWLVPRLLTCCRKSAVFCQ